MKLYDTYGWIAIASLLVCGLTGVFLVIPYDPVKGYLSVTTFITSNPAASLTRNIHYWSAQWFLVFTILHFIEHFRSIEPFRSNNKEFKRTIKKGTWFRLVLSLVVVFYVMLSGFILKNDGDARQAQLLLSTLITSIPLVGEFLGSAIVGMDGSLIITYLHHASTATIIIFIVIFEHVRRIKVKWTTFIITSAIIIAISLLFRAPISQLDEPVMKGPWFFIGIQELLHLVSNPLGVVTVLCITLFLVYIAPFANSRWSLTIKIITLIAGVSYGILTVSGYFLRGTMYAFQFPGNDRYMMPTTLDWKPFNRKIDQKSALVEIGGGVEGCMSCHKGMKGLSDSHKPEIIGCYSCHGGDPHTLNADAAHKRMFKVPGNLNNAAETCGGSGCHDNIVERLPKSMMATLSGMLSVDKWVFGEISSPAGFFNVNNLDNSAVGTHLKNLCAGCHIGMEKTTHGNANWLDRGGGCNACHLTYNNDALITLNEIQNKKSNSIKSKTIDNTQFHPSIDINITNDKCESCHSRSGRISMSYAGWHETELKELPSSAENGKYKLLPDGRVFTKQPADVHHESGLLCIDCHGSYELMGDGILHQHKEDAVKVQCIDCHPTDTLCSPNEFNETDEKEVYRLLSNTDRETQLVSWLRKWSDGNPKIMITYKDGQPLVNTRFNKNEGPYLLRKSDGKRLQLKPASTLCFNDKVHDRLSCESCHTSWVPQCIGCHNTFERNTGGYDMTKRKSIKGTWVEYTGVYMADAPVLGIKQTNKSEKEQQVGIFSPGMIMTIDKGSFHEKNMGKEGQKMIFDRLYAPTSGHTTQKQPRSCISCHLNPLALGYGRGKLELTPDGQWKFEPIYALNKNDKLPEDAWIGFLSERKDISSTRLNMRPFNIKEQKKILQAGACLTCHEEGSEAINLCLHDFEKAKHLASKACIIPR